MAQTDQETIFETGHEEMIHDAQFDYYGKRLATASSDRTIKIFDIDPDTGNQSLSATLSGHEGPVWRVCWASSRFGSLLASCGYDGRVIVWQEQAQGVWNQVWFDECVGSSLHALAFAPQSLGLVLLVGGANGFVFVYTHQADDTWSKETVGAHKGGVCGVAWAPDGMQRRFASCGADGAVKVWTYAEPSQADMEQYAQYTAQYGAEHGDHGAPPAGRWSSTTLLGHKAAVRDVAWAETDTIASAGADQSVLLWTGGKGGWTQSGAIRLSNTPWRVTWAPGGRVLGVAFGDAEAALYTQAGGAWVPTQRLKPVVPPAPAPAPVPAPAPAAHAPYAAHQPQEQYQQQHQQQHQQQQQQQYHHHQQQQPPQPQQHQQHQPVPAQQYQQYQQPQQPQHPQHAQHAPYQPQHQPQAYGQYPPQHPHAHY